MPLLWFNYIHEKRTVFSLFKPKPPESALAERVRVRYIGKQMVGKKTDLGLVANYKRG